MIDTVVITSYKYLCISGNDVTVVGYGAQIQVLRNAINLAKEELDISCELIDLRTIMPWDVDTVANVCKTSVYCVCV